MNDASRAAPTSASQRIADFLRAAPEITPASVRHQAARVLLNGLRATLAGTELDLGHNLLARQIPHGADTPGTASVLFDGRRLAAGSAALCNQYRWSALLLDEVEEVSGAHPGGPAALAALAVAESSNEPVSGRRFLCAIAAGIEVASAMAVAASPQMKSDRGFALLSAVAQMASASATCVVKDLPPAVAAHAIGMASMCGIGTWEMGGSSSAYLLMAQATRLGIEVSQAAEVGFASADRAIEGEFGAFRAYCGKDPAAISAVIDQLGQSWWTDGIAFQPYSGDTFSQAPLCAIRELRERIGNPVPAISDIIVHCSERMATGVRQKTSRHARIPDVVALNSDPCSRVAAAWLYGVYSFGDQFAGALHDTQVIDLRGRVQFVADSNIDGIDAARVEVLFADGRTEQVGVPAFPGSSRNPFSDDQIADLFRIEAQDRLPQQRTEAIINAVFSLDHAPDLSAILGLLNANPLDQASVDRDRETTPLGRNAQGQS